MRRLSVLPRTLVGRVFALYTCTLLFFVGAGVALFLWYQFTVELENRQEAAQSLVAVIHPTVADSAVIGDDDTIARTLERAIDHSHLALAAFIDVRGRQVRALQRATPDIPAPAWLEAIVAGRLYDANMTVVVGGRDYGVLRLRLHAGLLAGDLWRQARAALALALVSLAAGLFLIRLPLIHWLGHLERLRDYERALDGGAGADQPLNDESVPVELRQTFKVLGRAAESLHAQREQAAVTLAAIADAVLTLDTRGRIVLANPAACRAFGRSTAALHGEPVQRLLPDAFARGGEGFAQWAGRRLRVRAAEGRSVVLDTTLSVIAGADGACAGYVLACRDVTEQFELDQRLRDEQAARGAALTALRGVLEGLSATRDAASDAGEDDLTIISELIAVLVNRLQERSEQLSAIFTLSPDGFVSFDAEQRVAYVSPAFTRLTGLSEAELQGRDEAGFMDRIAALGRDMPDLARRLRADAGGDPGRVRLEIGRTPLRVLEATLQSSPGEVVSQVFHLRDITHETEVDRMKSEFLSSAAHELRTPMASIFGFCELLLHRSMKPEKQRELLEIIHRQSRLMISIINELLDLARIEARQGQDFVFEPVALGALLEDVVKACVPPEGRARPQCLLPTGEVLVRADRGKLTQALGNVLSNAYKYSPGGGAVGVEVMRNESHAAGGKDGAGLWGIRIRDEGIGLTPAQLARVCERFYRADASGSIPGTGLGMSIVKEITELHGGRLHIESEPARGTCVTLWLPESRVAIAA